MREIVSSVPEGTSISSLTVFFKRLDGTVTQDYPFKGLLIRDAAMHGFNLLCVGVLQESQSGLHPSNQSMVEKQLICEWDVRVHCSY